MTTSSTLPRKRLTGPLKRGLFHGFAGLTLAALALNASAGAALAQVPTLPPPPPPTFGSTFVVNTNTDTNDGVCDTQHCTLREAINRANANSSIFNLTDHIEFQLPIEQALLIQLAAPLPTVTSPLTIDGRNQPTIVETVVFGQTVFWAVPHPGVVEIHGGSQAADGLTVNTTATISNLALTGFSGTAPEVNFTGTKTLDSLNVHNNAGTGVDLQGSNATLSNSNISANNPGVRLAGSQNVVSGNTITGNVRGVRVSGSNDTLGGTSTAARNVISGNTGSGVELAIGSGTESLATSLARMPLARRHCPTPAMASPSSAQARIRSVVQPRPNAT